MLGGLLTDIANILALGNTSFQYISHTLLLHQTLAIFRSWASHIFVLDMAYIKELILPEFADHGFEGIKY